MNPLTASRSKFGSAGHLSHAWRRLVLAFFMLLLTGCSVMWVSNYDKGAADRVTDISKNVIKFYQDAFAVAPDKRASALRTSLASREGDAESLMRLHLLQEEARRKNDESVTVAKNMLASWRTFAVNHRSADKTALSDETLNEERVVMERHLRAAMVAEEAKKLASSN
jgi:hypothetical protein